MGIPPKSIDFRRRFDRAQKDTGLFSFKYDIAPPVVVFSLSAYAAVGRPDFNWGDLAAPLIWALGTMVVMHLGHFIWNYIRAGDRLALEDAREALQVAERERDEWKARVGESDRVVTQARLFIGLWNSDVKFGDSTTEGFPRAIRGHGGQLFNLYIYFHGDDVMMLERVRVSIAGEHYEAINWETVQVDSTQSGCVAYFSRDGITAGTHEVTIEGYAEGRWWADRRSHPIMFP